MDVEIVVTLAVQLVWRGGSQALRGIRPLPKSADFCKSVFPRPPGGRLHQDSSAGRMLVVSRTALVLLGVVAMCSSSSNLSADQMAKLDAPLQGLVRGDGQLSHLLTEVQSADGEARYAVILRVTDAAAVQSSGLPIGSTAGMIMTARLTVSEIRRAAGMAAIVAVETPERRVHQQNDG